MRTMRELKEALTHKLHHAEEIDEAREAREEKPRSIIEASMLGSALILSVLTLNVPYFYWIKFLGGGIISQITFLVLAAPTWILGISSAIAYILNL